MCAPNDSIVVNTVKPPAPINICSVRGDVLEMRWMNIAVSSVTGSISGTAGTGAMMKLIDRPRLGTLMESMLPLIPLFSPTIPLDV